METWRVCTYDVWGNEEEGYEVNDVYGGRTIDLPTDSAWPLGPDELCTFLRNADFLIGEPAAYVIDFTGEGVIYVNLANGKPLGELVRL